MRITKHGHSCLLVEDGEASLLLDPGVFSAGAAQLTGLSGVLVTHQHADHWSQEAVSALAAGNPGAVLVVDPETAEQVDGSGFAEVQVLRGGESTTVGGTEVLGVGAQHAVIHPDLPRIANTGYLIGGRLLHPGDALTVPDVEVELLAVPLVAPWCKLSETVDFVRAVHPRTAFPIHDALLVEMALGVFDGQVEQLGGTAYRRIDAEPLEV